MRDALFTDESRSGRVLRAAPGAVLRGAGLCVIALLRIVARPVRLIAGLVALGAAMALAIFLSQHHYVDAARACLLLALSVTVRVGVARLVNPPGAIFVIRQ